MWVLILYRKINLNSNSNTPTLPYPYQKYLLKRKVQIEYLLKLQNKPEPMYHFKRPGMYLKQEDIQSCLRTTKTIFSSVHHLNPF